MIGTPLTVILRALDVTVDPAVLAILRAGFPICYFCDDAGCHVYGRPDGTIWRVELAPGRMVRYVDDEPIFRNV